VTKIKEMKITKAQLLELLKNITDDVSDIEIESDDINEDRIKIRLEYNQTLICSSPYNFSIDSEGFPF
jgi:hypothetical protein